MCDDEIHQGLAPDIKLSRRSLGLAAVAAVGFATAAEAKAMAEVTEKDVTVKTPDGSCDAVLYTPPGKGPFPAVLIWTDIAGLRPAFRDMGRRLSANGYVVLVPNPFYRSAKAPVVDANFNFNDPDQRKRLFSYRAAMTNDGVDKDATAFIAFLDAQPKVSKKKKVGVQGYCMGGALVMRTGAISKRIGAGGSFHGGTLVSKNPDSSHLLAPKLHGEYLICEAQNDDKTDPSAKDTVRAAFEAANLKFKLDVYPAMHGWCVPGSAVYDPAQAERAWAELLSMYQRALV
jgi:carboxymethylenebutenolidase